MKKILFLLFILFVSGYSQRTSFSGLKFCFDPGHGGNNAANDRHVIPDPGINFWESESNFQKALHIKSLFEARGAWIMLTRYTNSYPNDNDEPSLTARWTMANQNNVHWFHSIHSNATGGNNTGTNSTLMLLKEDIATRKPVFPQADTISRILGRNIQQKNRTTGNSTSWDYTFYGGTNGGYNLGVLKGLVMPGQLSEGSFHDFYPETRRLMNNDYRKGEAYGILRGFQEYFKVPYDTVLIIAGIQKDQETTKPMNQTKVTLTPENKVYNGDSYNNGYYFFDNIQPGQKVIYFETPGYQKDSVVAYVTSNIFFFDKNLIVIAAPKIQYSVPKNGDTSVSVTGQMGVVFTREMDTTSLRQAFSITPEVPGIVSFTNYNKSIMFTLKNPLPYSASFVLKIDSTAKGKNGFFIDGNGDGTPGDPYIVNFRTLTPTSVEVENQNPDRFYLSQNYPNPFNPNTLIEYEIPQSVATEFVTLRVFDMLGREVETLVNQMQNPGKYSIRFPAAGNKNNFSTGIYYYELKAGKFSSIRKMMLIK